MLTSKMQTFICNFIVKMLGREKESKPPLRGLSAPHPRSHGLSLLHRPRFSAGKRRATCSTCRQDTG